MDGKRARKAIAELLLAMGQDGKRLGKTPERVAKMYGEFFSGSREDAAEILKVTHDEPECGGTVLARNIPFYSMCEHHLLPFFGRCHIAYIPGNGKLAGISKLARLVDAMSRKLQLQERLTADIAGAMMKHLRPKGVAVALEARHMCMEMRGVKKSGIKIFTSDTRGAFRRRELREEFFKLVRKA